MENNLKLQQPTESNKMCLSVELKLYADQSKIDTAKLLVRQMSICECVRVCLSTYVFVVIRALWWKYTRMKSDCHNKIQ